MNDAAGYAGGPVNLRDLRYKIGCETEKSWLTNRLKYERKGTQVECLRRGFGLGETHTFAKIDVDETFNESEHEESEVDEEGVHRVADIQLLRQGPREIQRCLEEDDVEDVIGTDRLDVTNQENSNNSQAAFEDMLEHIHDFIASQNEFSPDDFEGNSPDNWNVEALFKLLEKLSIHFFRDERAARWENENQTFVSLLLSGRHIRDMEESFSEKKIRTVLTPLDFKRIFTALTTRRGGKVFYTLLGMSPHLNYLDYFQGISFCEVNADRKQLVFFVIGRDTEPHEWYVKVMVQQHVMPKEKWSIKFMRMDSLLQLIYALVLRIESQPVIRANLRRFRNQTLQWRIIRYLDSCITRIGSS